MNNLKITKSVIVAVTVIASTSFAQKSSPLVQTSAARKPASQLQYRQSGIPVFSFVKVVGNQKTRVKEIPALDIGQERQLKSQDYKVKLPSNKELKLRSFSKISSPNLIQINTEMTKYQPVIQAKKITPEKPTIIPSVKPIETFYGFQFIEPRPQLVNLVEIKPDEYKIIQALIFKEYHKKYDLAMSLFVELMDIPEYRTEAMYHYAITAREQKLFSEFRQKMIQVTQETKNEILQKMAVESLVQNINFLEISDIKLIDPLAYRFEVFTDNYPSYMLKKAKYELEVGNLGEAEVSLNSIPPSAPEYKEGILLKAIFNYRQGQVDVAIQDLEMLWPLIENEKKNQVRNLAALTLARLYFQKADYASAYKNYLKVDKSSGQWLQSMVEQAWTQVLSGDNIGAAGNMFALHTDYFKKAYAPETYIVRTVGYLNLCQYGDGISVLSDLKKKYNSVYDNMISFQKKNPDGSKYYDLVKTWIKNTSTDQVDGLPRSFIVELARHPNYMSVQKQINMYEEENSRFNKITIDLIRKERLARLQMLKTKNAVTAAKNQKKSPLEIQSAEKKFLAAGVEHVIYAKARDGIKKMREAAVTRLEIEKSNLIKKAGNNLKSRYQLFTSTLEHLIDQNEVLSYEIYSGAGEHIRYQMAGGEANQTENRSLANDKNAYQWKFKDEVWEDEIGHFRSSLKNVCPKEETTENDQEAEAS